MIKERQVLLGKFQGSKTNNGTLSWQIYEIYSSVEHKSPKDIRKKGKLRHMGRGGWAGHLHVSLFRFWQDFGSLLYASH